MMVADALRVTEAFPAVPLDTYPAVDTVGVTLTVFVSVSVLLLVLIVALLPLMVDGAVTVPAATALVACEA